MRHFNYNLANLGKHLGASALIALYASCNQMKDANLKVAGGTLDSTATYSSTVYVEMNGLDFNGQKKPPVRNVGTFVKIPGLEGFRVLILSLADVLIENGANSQIPLFKEIDLKIYGKDGTASPFVPRLDFDQNSGGVKLAGSAQSDYITAFGFSVVQDGPSEIPKDVFNRMKGRLFSLGSVPNDFRNSRTTFLMLAMREAEVARFGIGPSPTLIPADKRDPSIKKFVVVGYGQSDYLSQANAAKNQQKSNFSLDGLPSINKRNFANVTLLTDTPFSKISQNSPVLWETQGSGLCGKNTDGTESYDTGAGLYASPDQFVGFAIKSTSMPKFEGTLICGETPLDQMATLILSPTSADIAVLQQNISAGGGK